MGDGGRPGRGGALVEDGEEAGKHERADLEMRRMVVLSTAASIHWRRRRVRGFHDFPRRQRRGKACSRGYDFGKPAMIKGGFLLQRKRNKQTREKKGPAKHVRWKGIDILECSSEE